jgi:hypothetical protein
MPYSRKDYMDGVCTHRQYYAQFVTDGVKAMVARAISIQVLVASTDPHLNDIQLSRWDRLATGVRADDNSLASRVCVLKEAARQLIEETNGTHPAN